MNRGVRICTWEVDDPVAIARLFELGADAVETNDPAVGVASAIDFAPRRGPPVEMSYVIGADVGSQSVKAVLMSRGRRGDRGARARPARCSFPAPGWAEQQPGEWTLGARGHDPAGPRGGGHRGRGDRDDRARVSGGRARAARFRPASPSAPRSSGSTGEPSTSARASPSAVGEDELVETHGAESRRVAYGAQGDVVPRSRAGALREDALARTGLDLRDRLADRRGRPGSRQRVVHPRSTTSPSVRGPSSLVDRAGLDAARLPQITRATEIVGALRPAAAAALGLTTGCRVVTGTGDEHGAALGAGALAPAVVVDITGTAEPVVAPSAELVLDETRLVETHAHAVDEMLLVENPGFVSGGSTRWLAELVGVSQGELLALAEHARPGMRRRRFIPALSGATTPRWNAQHARSVRGSRHESRRLVPRPGRARGMRIRAPRHRRPARRARARRRRDPRRRRRRAVAALAPDQGRRHGPAGARAHR